MRYVARPVALALVAVLALAACGGDDGGPDPEAQPSPDVTTFEEGDFAGLPLPPLAEEAGERTEEDGIVTQSFFVRNRTPQEVLELYARLLADDGVQVIADPEAVGESAWRGWWLLDDRELLVAAQPAPTTGGVETEHADVVTQLSLELWPVGSAEEHSPLVPSSTTTAG